MISFPLSLGAGDLPLWYAKRSFDQFGSRTCEILSSLPSVVVGLFGCLGFVVQSNTDFPIISGPTAPDQSLTCTTDDPQYRKAACSTFYIHSAVGLTLGLSRLGKLWFMSWYQALPRSIITRVVLASGRIFGSCCLDLYCRSITAPALISQTGISLVWPVHFDLPSGWNLICPYLEGQQWRNYSRLDRSLQPGSAGLLLIFILILTLGINSEVTSHKKLTVSA